MFGFDPIWHGWSYHLAAFCAIGATLLTFFEVFKHLQNYEQPSLQRYIIRILWLVPIFAIDSLLSLLYPEYSLLLDTLRDCYESFVLYCFFSLLLAYLGPERDSILEELPPTPFPWPLGFLPWVKPGPRFLMMCRRAILQFVFVKPILAITAFVLDYQFGLYEEGDLSPNSGYLWITLIANLSVTVSFYFLVMFSYVVREPLRRFRPVPKFFCVKAVVFFSWWQGVLIAILGAAGAIQATKHLSQQAVAIGIQDLLICIEMFLIAIAHHWAFSYQEFASHHLTQTPLLTSAHPTYELQRIASSTHHVLNFTEDVSQVNQTFSSQARKRGDDVSSEDEA